MWLEKFRGISITHCRNPHQLYGMALSDIVPTIMLLPNWSVQKVGIIFSMQGNLSMAYIDLALHVTTHGEEDISEAASSRTHCPLGGTQNHRLACSPNLREWATITVRPFTTLADEHPGLNEMQGVYFGISLASSRVSPHLLVESTSLHHAYIRHDIGLMDYCARAKIRTPVNCGVERTGVARCLGGEESDSQDGMDGSIETMLSKMLARYFEKAILADSFNDRQLTAVTRMWIREVDGNIVLLSIADYCDIETTDKKMGGATTINCYYYYYNITAQPKRLGTGGGGFKPLQVDEVCQLGAVSDCSRPAVDSNSVLRVVCQKFGLSRYKSGRFEFIQSIRISFSNSVTNGRYIDWLSFNCPPRTHTSHLQTKYLVLIPASEIGATRNLKGGYAFGEFVWPWFLPKKSDVNPYTGVIGAIILASIGHSADSEVPQFSHFRNQGQANSDVASSLWGRLSRGSFHVLKGYYTKSNLSENASRVDTDSETEIPELKGLVLVNGLAPMLSRERGTHDIKCTMLLLYAQPTFFPIPNVDLCIVGSLQFQSSFQDYVRTTETRTPKMCAVNKKQSYSFILLKTSQRLYASQ
ncbi:uncharacterized protein BDR25DRAFT_353222 [Lindgomyces ingoldianus]|uniref:Uncharacterized protein n=1 Tax=Lindgomyces ingoldianus TaxID=673940 RepID=A0ACB6R0V5_9PLEO|nr:uncharacterized protein BDR25DRAFT_353222 [Lindgomyces ingoldianus]KAF2472908.1 hypothetical protein BDR25DRAFT_353222 [Lindgomyces ingoldianus]